MNPSPPLCNMSRAIRRQSMIKWIRTNRRLSRWRLRRRAVCCVCSARRQSALIGSQLGYHGTHSGGGNPPTRQQTAPDRLAAGRRRQGSHMTRLRRLAPVVQRTTTAGSTSLPLQKPAAPSPWPLSEPPSRPPPIPSHSIAITPANSAAMNTDRHPHSNRTGAPDHFQRTTDGPRQRGFLPPRAFAILKEQKELIERTVSDPSSPQQHLISVLRKLQADFVATYHLWWATTTRMTMKVLASTKLTTMTTTRPRCRSRHRGSSSQLTRCPRKHCISCNSWKPQGSRALPVKRSDAIHCTNRPSPALELYGRGRRRRRSTHHSCGSSSL